MAKYSDIKGFTVQTLSSDTAASVIATGTWASGGALNEARASVAGVGTQTAALCFGGDHGGPTPEVANTETYNGTSWTEVNDMNTAKRLICGMGTSYTAALSVGGYTPPGYRNLVESWDGTNWTETTETNSNKGAGGQAGTSTAGIAFAGVPPAPMQTNEYWNGSSWTELADLNTGRRNLGSAGTVYTAAIAFGGNTISPPGDKAISELWNGSSWTEVGDINNTRAEIGSAGTSTAALGFGGYTTTNQANTEAWDGTSWTEVADLATARRELSPQASNSDTSALAFGGSPVPGVGSSTEEWTTTPSALFQKTVEGQLFFNSTTNAFKETILDFPAATWSSGGNLNTGRYGTYGSGTQTAALCSGGDLGPSTTNTEAYNGSSWTELNEMNTARYSAADHGIGTQTAALAVSGYTPGPNTNVTNVESWDGSNWTEVGDVNTGRRGGAPAGIQTSGLFFAGTGGKALTESWNGSAWTEVSDLNTAREELAGCGASNTSAIAISGSEPPETANVETWDGSSWTEVGNVNNPRSALAASGTTSTALTFGGAPGTKANTEFWNGSSWTEVNDLSTARNRLSASKTSSAIALAFAGSPGGTAETATEEFTVSLANKTITTS